MPRRKARAHGDHRGEPAGHTTYGSAGSSSGLAGSSFTAGLFASGGHNLHDGDSHHGWTGRLHADLHIHRDRHGHRGSRYYDRALYYGHILSPYALTDYGYVSPLYGYSRYQNFYDVGYYPSYHRYTGYGYQPYYPSTYNSYTTVYNTDSAYDRHNGQSVYSYDDSAAGADSYGGSSSLPPASGVVVVPQTPLPSAQGEGGTPTGSAGSPAGPIAPATIVAGHAAFSAGRYGDARRYYVEAVLDDAGDGYAKLFYALANFALGDHELSAKAVRSALSSSPDLVANPIDLRSFYADPDVLRSQLDTLLRVIEEHPGDLHARFLLGYLYFATGEGDKALVVFESLTEASPSDKQAAALREAVREVLVRRREQP